MLQPVLLVIFRVNLSYLAAPLIFILLSFLSRVSMGQTENSSYPSVRGGAENGGPGIGGPEKAGPIIPKVRRRKMEDQIWGEVRRWSSIFRLLTSQEIWSSIFWSSIFHLSTFLPSYFRGPAFSSHYFHTYCSSLVLLFPVLHFQSTPFRREIDMMTTVFFSYLLGQ